MKPLLVATLLVLSSCKPSFEKAHKSICEPTCGVNQICRKKTCFTTCKDDTTCGEGEKCGGISMHHRDGNTSFTEAFSACVSEDSPWNPEKTSNKKPVLKFCKTDKDCTADEKCEGITGQLNAFPRACLKPLKTMTNKI